MKYIDDCDESFDRMRDDELTDAIDLAALQEAEAVLSNEIPSSPETYRAVKEWYGKNSASVETVKQDISDLPF